MIKEATLRKCVGCGEMISACKMIRVTRGQDGNCVIRRDRSVQGRSAYVCRNIDCIRLATKRKALNRSLKTTVSEQLMQELYSEVEVEDCGQ